MSCAVSPENTARSGHRTEQLSAVLRAYSRSSGSARPRLVPAGGAGPSVLRVGNSSSSPRVGTCRQFSRSGKDYGINAHFYVGKRFSVSFQWVAGASCGTRTQ